MTEKEQQEKFESVSNQLDLVNLLTTLSFSETESAFELLSPMMLRVIKNICDRNIKKQHALAS